MPDSTDAKLALLGQLYEDGRLDERGDVVMRLLNQANCLERSAIVEKDEGEKSVLRVCASALRLAAREIEEGQK